MQDMDVREMSAPGDASSPRGSDDGSAAASVPLGRLCCRAHVALALMWLHLIPLPSTQPEGSAVPNAQLQAHPFPSSHQGCM